jgi:site-specific recombinase XerD
MTAPPIVATERAEVTDYLRYIEAARGYSAHTVVSYRHDLKVFADWLDQKYPAGWEWSTPPRADFRAFLGDLQRNGRSKETVGRQIAALRSFYRFMRNLLDRDLPNIARQTRTPKTDKKLPKHLQPEQTRALFRLAEHDVIAAPSGFAKHQAIRDLAIVETFYSTGLRLAELVGLDRDHVELTDRVDSNRGWVFVANGKGGKQRWVPLGSHAVRALNAWIPSREAVADYTDTQSRAMFTSMRGGRIFERTVQRRIKKLLCRIGAPHLTVHSLRHTFGTDMRDAGASIRAVQAMMGHESINQTGRYQAVAVSSLKAVYLACHPRADVDGTQYLEGPACRPDEPEAIP